MIEKRSMVIRTGGLRQEVKVVALMVQFEPCSYSKIRATSVSSYKISHYLRHFLQPISVSTRSLVSIMSNNDNNINTNKGEQPNLDSIFKQKRILRSKVRQTLKSMDPSLRSHEDNAIQNIVLEAPWFKSSQRLCAYISCSALREVDTSKLLSQILHTPTNDGDMRMVKKLYVPRVEDKNSNMKMFHISSVNDLIANSMNILEPAPVDTDGNEREDVLQANEPVDLLLLPGLAFDRSGRRMGRGGGYYDNFLKQYHELAKEKIWKEPLMVALSYSLQIMDEGIIPVTPNDVLVDALVTPSGVIPISQAALESQMKAMTCHSREATADCPLIMAFDIVDRT